MPDKKLKLKKRKPIERVYKDGREAIVRDAARKPLIQKKRTLIKPDEPVPIQKQIIKSNPITINEYELPSYSSTSRITLIAKDPFWIYAYWEIADSSVEDVRLKLGGSLDGTRFVVRMYDVTYRDFNGFNANHWFDIEVGRYSTNWYISLWHANS